MKFIPFFLRKLLTIALFTALTGCGEKPASAPSTGGMPPPEVGVVTISPERIAITTELPGRLDATRIAQVRARVPGIIQKRVFREGSEVKAGAVLFNIDPAPFEANLRTAQAALAKAEANLAQATLKAQRYKPLIETNAISKQEYDDVITAQKQTTADVASAKASMETARLNLSYATVTAPIAGRIGRAQVTEGALVGQGEATPLAVIQQLDPIYVNLTQSGVELLRLQQSIANGKLKSAGKDFAKVTLLTEDGSIYPLTGNLLYSDVSVDESTGSISMRAEFSNPDHVLLPGMYVRARLDQAIDEQAITVPQQAVQRSPDGAAVLVVGTDGKVATQSVITGAARDGKWVISQGLKAGDRVIVEGLQKAKPGTVVKPMPWKGTTPGQENKVLPAKQT